VRERERERKRERERSHSMILALLVVTLGVSFLVLRRRKKPDFIASFAGKHVLITGASSGIGLAL
jgi:NADPH:quinone reductase-like Zn-dependent oxidoreductase